MQVTSLTCPYCQSFSGIWRVQLHPSYLFVSFCLCFVDNLMVTNTHPESWERSASSTELGRVQQILDFQHKRPNVNYYYIVVDDVPSAIMDIYLCLNSRRSAGSHWASLQPSYPKSLFTYIAKQGGCSSSHLPVWACCLKSRWRSPGVFFQAMILYPQFLFLLVLRVILSHNFSFEGKYYLFLVLFHSLFCSKNK